MAAVLSRTRVGLKVVSSTTTVPKHPTARLMYYMECICAVLDITDEPSLERLMDYKNYRRLSDDETATLLGLCLLFSPDVLLNKCIFLSEELCGDSSNKFFELSAARQTLAVTENIVIGNQVRKVRKIMTFKKDWLQWNYVLPLASFRERGVLRSTGAPRTSAAVGSSEGDRLLGPRQEDGCSPGCCICGFLKVLGFIICCPIVCVLSCCCGDN